MRRILQGADPFSRWDHRTLFHQAGGHVRPGDFRTRRTIAAAGLLLGTAITIAGFRLVHVMAQGEEAAAADTLPAPSARSPLSGSASKGSASDGSASDGSVSAGSASDRSGAGSSKRPSVRSTGVYDPAPGASARHGSGPLRTYRVEVETGAGQSASAFAAAVDATLAARASWTGHGLWSLQRVEGEVDFVVRLATPATVDKVCATAGLHTRGYVSCRAGHFVMINLDRWLDAVPHFGGNIALYRHYLINHEVGHQLGYAHEPCPGPGRPAPIMQQQTYGLGGCRANGWPYVHGKLT
jgi:hypothetical protein